MPADLARHVEADPRCFHLGFEHERSAERRARRQRQRAPRAARTARLPRSDRPGRPRWCCARTGCERGRRRGPAYRAGARQPGFRGRASRRPPGPGRSRPGRWRLRPLPRARPRARPLARRRMKRRSSPASARSRRRRRAEPRRLPANSMPRPRTSAGDRSDQFAGIRRMYDGTPSAFSALMCLPQPAATETAWGKLTAHGARVIGQIEQARIIEPAGAAAADRLGHVRPADPGEEVRDGAVGEDEVRHLARARGHCRPRRAADASTRARTALPRRHDPLDAGKPRDARSRPIATTISRPPTPPPRRHLFLGADKRFPG